MDAENKIIVLSLVASNKKGLEMQLVLNGKKWKIYGKKKGNKFYQQSNLIIDDGLKLSFDIRGEIIDRSFSSDDLKLRLEIKQILGDNIIDITPNENFSEEEEEEKEEEQKEEDVNWENVI